MIVANILIHPKSLLVIASIFLLCFWLWNRRRIFALVWNFPNKLNIQEMFSLLRHVTNALSIFEKIFDKKDTHTLYLWLGLYPALLTRDPVIIEKILSSPDMFNKAHPIYTAMNDALKGGLLTSPESEWRSHRKWINSSFNQRVLVRYLPILNRIKNKLIADCDKLVDGESHKFVTTIQSNIFGASFEILMGKELNYENKDTLKLTKSFRRGVRRLTFYIFMAHLKLNKILVLSEKYRKLLNLLQDFLNENFQQRVENENTLLEKNIKDENNGQCINGNLKGNEMPPIFIDRIFYLFKEKKFTWQNVLSESNIMLLAAVETTSKTLYTTLVLLAMHSSVQERLYKEICEVFNGISTNVEDEHLNQLPYLDLVIQEVLRLVPPIPMIGRQFSKPMQLSDNLVIPKGFQIIMSIFHLHRRKDIWGQDANEFNPERFLASNLLEKHSHAYIPFSKGNRNCIGWRYANLSLKTMLVGLIRNYRFETDFEYKNLQFINTITISFKEEPKFKIYRRK